MSTIMNTHPTISTRIQIQLLEWTTNGLTNLRYLLQKTGLSSLNQSIELDQWLTSLFEWVDQPTAWEMIVAVTGGGIIGLVLGILIFMITR